MLVAKVPQGIVLDLGLFSIFFSALDNRAKCRFSKLTDDGELGVQWCLIDKMNVLPFSGGL